MGYWDIDELEQYLISLFVIKKTCEEILTKVKNIAGSLELDEQLAIGIEKNGNELHVILKVFCDTKPKCWIEDFQYKFNSYVVTTLRYPTGNRNAKSI